MEGGSKQEGGEDRKEEELAEPSGDSSYHNLKGFTDLFYLWGLPMNFNLGKVSAAGKVKAMCKPIGFQCGHTSGIEGGSWVPPPESANRWP